MKTVLHLGVHKTATTSLQQSLILSRRALKENGIAAPRLARLRNGFTRLVFQAAEENRATPDLLEQSAAFLDPFRNKYRRLILSDENFLGAPRQVLRSGLLYPFALIRLQCLRDLLASEDIEIMLSLRESGPFLSALYVEALKNGYYRPVDDVATAFHNAPPDWSSLIDMIRAVFPQSPITLWDHADYMDLKDQVMDRLADNTLRWTHPEKRHRVTPGGEAVAALIALAGQKGQAALLEQAPRIVARYPSTTPAFKPWSRALESHLKQSYQSHITALKTRPDLIWLA